MFFYESPGQFQFNIIQLVESYGEPEIVSINDKLHITLKKVDCQNLFVIKNDELIGVLIYVRNLPDNIELVHIVVDEKYSFSGEYADEMLVFKMINKFKEK